jgi:hypothetical protein
MIFAELGRCGACKATQTAGVSPAVRLNYFEGAIRPRR